MATYFVKQTAIVATPADTNDGLDPIGFNLSAATFTTSTKTLNKTGAFASYTFTAGDLIYISGGTGVTAGLYEIASKTDNDNIVLVEDIGGTNPSDVTSSNGPFLTVGKGNTVTINGGDELRICADAVYTQGLLSLLGDGTATTGHLTWTGANSRGVVDQTKAALEGTGTYTLYGNTSDFRKFQYLDIYGDVTYETVELTDCEDSIFYRCRIRSASGAHTYAAVHIDGSSEDAFFVECEITGNGTTGTGSIGIRAAGPVKILGCAIHDCAGNGIWAEAYRGTWIENSLIYKNASRGVYIDSGSYNGCALINCVVHGNSGDGIRFSNSVSNASLHWFSHNIIANNGGYGINRQGSHYAAPGRNNVYWQNTTAPSDSSDISVHDWDSVEGDPKFVNTGAGTEDYRIQSDSAAAGAGIGVMPSGGTSYWDVGAFQRQELVPDGKRFSWLGFGDGTHIHTTFEADSSVDKDDRASLLDLYNGVQVNAPLPNPDLWKGYFCGDMFVHMAGLTKPDVIDGGTPGAGSGPAARWIKENDEEVWWGAFLCKVAAAPAGAPPTISIDNDPVTGGSLVWTLSPDLGSENVITGKWHDSDNDLITPATFKIFINEVERTSDGIFNSGASPFSSIQQPWTFSSQLFRLSDDHHNFRVEITDDQGNAASATRKLEYPYVDPLRAMTDHPRPRTSLWSWSGSTPFFTPDSTGRWIQSNTGWEGGLEMTGTYSIEITASTAAGTTGDWRPDFRIMLPDPGTELKITAVLNGDTGNPYDEWIESGPQTHTGFPNVDDTNIHVDQGSNNLVNLQDGDHFKITFQTLSAPSGNYPWWEFSDIRQVTVSGPPPTQTQFWAWSAGDITQADWNTYRSGLGVGAQGRPVGANNDKHTFNVVDTGQPYRVHAGQGDEVAEMLAGGEFRFRRDQTPRQDEHCTLVPSGGYEGWTTSFYLMPQRNYRFEFGLTIEDPPDLDTYWRDDSFKLFFQAHPGTFPGGWTGNTNPPLALMAFNGMMDLRVRGSNQTTPTFFTSQTTDQWPITTGHHDFVIETRFDFTGVWGHCRLWQNGQQRVNRNGPVGINHSAAAVPNSMFVAFGLYTFADGGIAQADYFRITEVF